MPQDEYDHKEMKKLLQEVLLVSRENNKILHSVRRISIIEFVVRLLWYAFLIGLPFAVYFYILDPYLKAVGISSEHFGQGIQGWPGTEFFAKIFRH